MRLLAACVAEFLTMVRWPLKVTVWLMLLMLAAWGLALPVLEAMDAELLKLEMHDGTAE